MGVTNATPRPVPDRKSLVFSDARILQLAVFLVFCCETTCCWVFFANRVLTYIINLRLDHHVYVLLQKMLCCRRLFSLLIVTVICTRWKHKLRTNSYSILHRDRQFLIKKENECRETSISVESIIPWAKWMAYTRYNIHIPATFIPVMNCPYKC